MYGELQPLGGGDTIPLLKQNLMIGRRESCDIVLRFANVSAHHCEIFLDQGYWYVKDLNSRNGTKVNGVRVAEKRLDPGDEFSVAKHHYQIRYSPAELGAEGPPPADDFTAQILGRSLLERAGLDRGVPPERGAPRKDPAPPERYNPLSGRGGRFRDPEEPI